jgi:hypothetical protein
MIAHYVGDALLLLGALFSVFLVFFGAARFR